MEHLKKTPGRNRGFFLAIEGLDGAGKSCQAQRLIAALAALGLNPLRIKEPTDGPWGRKIREIAVSGRDGLTPEEELNFFVLDRADDVNRNIVPALLAGRPVVADRYILSNVIYQSALGLSEDHILDLNKKFPWPDLTVVLELSVTEGLARIAAGRAGGANKGFESAAYLEKVKRALDGLDPGKYPGLVRLDGRESMEALTERILNLLRERGWLPDPSLTVIDTHCHLSLGDFDQDGTEVLARARASGVRAILDVGLDPASWELVLERARRPAEPPEIYAVLGWHPHEAERAPGEDPGHKLLAEKLADPKVVALGEIGLDYFRKPKTKAEQLQAFESQLELAAALDLPVAVHSRDAFDDTLKMLTRLAPKLPRGGVIHCFTGPWAEARAYLDLGFYLSLPGVVTFPKAEALREVAAKAPADRLLVETDAPYMTPEPFRGRRNEPAWLAHHLRAVAEARGQTLRQAARMTYDNARALFRLP